MSALHLRPYRGADEAAAIDLWHRTWQQAYPQIDFAARLAWWRERWRKDLVPNASIVVAEQASAVTTGTTKTQRTSSTKNSVTALAGVTKATSPLANLAGVSGDTQLNGQGTTSRVTTLSTTLTARVAAVLPGGALLVDECGHAVVVVLLRSASGGR